MTYKIIINLLIFPSTNVKVDVDIMNVQVLHLLSCHEPTPRARLALEDHQWYQANPWSNLLTQRKT